MTLKKQTRNTVELLDKPYHGRVCLMFILLIYEFLQNGKSFCMSEWLEGINA